jgi:hypothetical protein
LERVALEMVNRRNIPLPDKFLQDREDAIFGLRLHRRIDPVRRVKF